MRQYIATGQCDKDAYDQYIFSASEEDLLLNQIELASMVKHFYEQVGNLHPPSGAASTMK
jgi:hypothetical protein